jgi:hypothetical protein
MALESDMVSRLVFFFFGFITCPLPAEPDSSIKAGVAVPARAPRDAAPGSKSGARARPTAEGTRPMALKTAAMGNLVPISRVVFYNSRSSLTPFGYVVGISAQCLTQGPSVG